MECRRGYTSVVMDKNGLGARPMQLAVVANGVPTAQMFGVRLSMGPVQLEHHLHVFVSDDSKAGIEGRMGMEQAATAFLFGSVGLA